VLSAAGLVLQPPTQRTVTTASAGNARERIIQEFATALRWWARCSIPRSEPAGAKGPTPVFDHISG